jgi:hypothetical protein
MSNEKNVISELHDELQYLVKGIDTLLHAYKHCSEIGLKTEYTFDELDKWEALTARFARLSDILTQKVFSSMMIILNGQTGSLIDKANFAEKYNLVVNSQDFTKLRLLRNFIAYEYAKQNTNEIFEKVFENCLNVVGMIQKVDSFCRAQIFDKISD